VPGVFVGAAACLANAADDATSATAAAAARMRFKLFLLGTGDHEVRSDF
jgi:hypothetical protein